MTVFAPSPLNPPQIPLISRVGRAHTRSSVVKPASPNKSFAPIDDFHLASEWGSFLIAFRSLAVSFRTLS
jgi:hypothetical protein